MNDLAEKVVALLVDICDTPEVAEEPDADLFEAGLLDSLGFTELLVSIDDEFGVTLSPTEVDRDELCSVNKIVDYLRGRLG